MYTFVKKNNLYGVLFQIKDLFELLLKFPVLLILEEYVLNTKREEKDIEILFNLFSQNLSLGHWQSIATSCLNRNFNSYLSELIKETVSLFNQYEIVNWRNQNIGHGLTQQEESFDFLSDLKNKLFILNEHFTKNDILYKKIDIRCVSKKFETHLIGEDIKIKRIKNDGFIYLFDNNRKIKLKIFLNCITKLY